MALFGWKIKPLKVLASVFCSQARHDIEIRGLQETIESLEDLLSLGELRAGQLHSDLAQAHRDLRSAEELSGVVPGAFAGVGGPFQGQSVGGSQEPTGGPDGPGASGLGYSPLG